MMGERRVTHRSVLGSEDSTSGDTTKCASHDDGDGCHRSLFRVGDLTLGVRMNGGTELCF